MDKSYEIIVHCVYFKTCVLTENGRATPQHFYEFYLSAIHVPCYTWLCYHASIKELPQSIKTKYCWVEAHVKIC